MSTTTQTPPPVFNLPNQLTAARLVLAVILFGLIQYGLWIACMAVFAVAAFTDWLDGYLARKQGLTSTLGRNLDPLVDKVLVCGAYIYLLPVPNSGVFAWMATLMVARELIITGLRSFMENAGATFGADWLGKIKMTLQCAALIAVFVALESPSATFDVIRDVLLYMMLFATAWSGLQYLWKAFAVFRKMM